VQGPQGGSFVNLSLMDDAMSIIQLKVQCSFCLMVTVNQKKNALSTFNVGESSSVPFTNGISAQI
jgi:hypothetical protein